MIKFLGKTIIISAALIAVPMVFVKRLAKWSKENDENTSISFLINYNFNELFDDFL